MKSIFTKLSTLLLFGAFAMVGCTDFSEDIQAVDKKVDGLTTELNSYKTSTAATIAELQSAIAALEATQEQMAADYAKKSELEAAKSELQDKLNTLNSKIESAAAEAAAAIAELDAAKADKTALADLQKTVNEAIAKANDAIAALEAAKADKTQVDQIEGDVAILKKGYEQMIAQFQNLSLIVDGKADQADLELVQADVNSLKKGYMENVAALQNLAGRMEAAEGAIELAEGDIADLKKAAAEAVFAITNLNAQVEALDARVEALEGEMKKVQSEIALHTATLQNLAGRLEAAEGAIEDEAAAREKADKALQEAVSLLNMGLTNLKTSYEVHVEEFEAYKNNMAKAMDDLAAQDAALANSILDYYNQSIAAVDSAIQTLRAEQAEAIADLEEKILKAWEDERALIYNTIADIQKTLFAAIEEGDTAIIEAMEAADALIYKTIDSYRGILEIAMLEGDAAVVEAMEAADALIYKTIDDIENTLFIAIEEGDAAVLEAATEQLNEALALVYNTIEDIKKTLFIAIEEGDAAVAKAAQDALDDAVALIYKTIGSTKQELQAELAESNKNLTEYVDDAVALIYKTIASNKADIQAEIQDLRNELETILGGLTANVTALLERVQSLVYVPDYDDHKATISWAELSGEESYGVLVKKSVLRYRVYAKANEDAVAAAKAIATTWTPETFYYEVEPVKRAWTRSATVPASLEITKVEAKGEYLEVEVLAKNFNPEFFFSYWYGDNNPRMAIKPEEGKPADEKSSYSVSLVLSDGNNNRSTEYTNLVPAYPEYIQAVVLDGNKKDITFMECPETEPANLLPYDLDPKEVVVLKDHALSFVWEGKNYSAAELIAAGYDIQLERRQHFTYPDADEAQTDYRVDGKPQDFAVLGDDVKFQIHEKDFVSEIEEGNTTVTLTRALTKAEYLALEDKTLDIDFVYNINGVEIYTTSTVEICNRLVVVDLGDVEIPWTMELAYNLHDGTKAYALPVKYTGYEYDLAKCANKPLEGYNLYSILQTGSPKKTHGGDYDIQMSISDKTLNFTLSGKYAFANVYDQDGWNDHTVQWVNEFEDLTITVKANIKLGQIPGTLNFADSGLEFKLVPGVNGWVYANSNIVEKMFAKYRDLVGFADDDEAAKAFFSERLAASKVLARELNGEINTLLDPQNIDTPIYSFDPLKLGIHQSQIADVEKQTMFVQQWDKVTGANFAFDFDGTVVLPEYGLEYSTVDFVSYDANQERWEVEVDGDIVADASVAHGRKYTIDQADLGKYFYVNDNVEYGVETALTVQFEVLTKNAPLPLDTDVVGVFEDASSQINVLEEGKSVIKDWTNGGLFVGNEIEVKATLLANGFPIDTKDVTLYTVDPLTFSKTGDMVVERVPGKDAIAYTHSVLSLTSIAEEGNLINTESYPSQVFVDKYANEVYGAAFISQPAENPEWNCQLVRVYTLENGEKVTYPGVKYMFNNGKVTLIADDGLLKQSIFAEVEYKLTHNYNYGQDETVTVVVEFKPNNAL